ncbi:putative glutamine amidotransferase [Brucella abortus A13334]|nr:putative glutamine amidotransferase [Brucella abortus A13334]
MRIVSAEACHHSDPFPGAKPVIRCAGRFNRLFLCIFYPKAGPRPRETCFSALYADSGHLPSTCRHGGFVLQLSDIKLNEALSFNGSKGSRAVKNMVAAAMYNQNILPLLPYSPIPLTYCLTALFRPPPLTPGTYPFT